MLSSFKHTCLSLFSCISSCRLQFHSFAIRYVSNNFLVVLLMCICILYLSYHFMTMFELLFYFSSPCSYLPFLFASILFSSVVLVFSLMGLILACFHGNYPLVNIFDKMSAYTSTKFVVPKLSAWDQKLNNLRKRSRHIHLIKSSRKSNLACLRCTFFNIEWFSQTTAYFA